MARFARGATAPPVSATGPADEVGASCTALRHAREAAGAEERLCFRDIDGAGVPAGVDSDWRREQVAMWLEEAARLLGRVATPEAAADLLRVTGQTLPEYLDAVTRYSAALRASYAGRPDTAVIDTSSLAPEQVADAVRSWLQEQAQDLRRAPR